MLVHGTRRWYGYGLHPPEWPPSGVYKELHPRNTDPIKIWKKISSNSYVQDVTSDLGMGATFNIKDLTIH